MKNLLWVLMLLPGTVVFGQKNGYVIEGRIAGESEGMKVYLSTTDYPEPKTVDSSVIKKGKFTLKGSVDIPAQYKVIIDKTAPGQPKSQRNWISTAFYVENSKIGFAGHIDSLPTYFYNSKKKAVQPVITGSATQEEYLRYTASTYSLRTERQKLDNEYNEVYHLPALKGEFNSKEGLELVRKISVIGAEMEKIKWTYIRNNPKSVVAYDLAKMYFQDIFVTLTVPQIDDLVEIIKKGWGNSAHTSFIENAAVIARKTAIGTKYQDFELATPDGKRVMISDYVPKGKYTLLEFWASWCGPCRGEIPHLREVNKNKADNFEIVSISLDEKDEAWKRAMKEEGMIWTQLCEPYGFEGKIAKAYNITAIPFSLLLDKDGYIIKVDVRGAYLDLALEGI